ncbi:ATP-binding cassette domain-containing protein [Noviherbaspirillum massiliense]|uniref:ATP-binding cassette domain-containing protein n=1 Tax=Noviherbaspirillum massiliense TaxID=1465823 RepID=UPI0002FDE83B|nr:ATP-binding cassette domain-containing protein [Noviherbaspirillum massiliense]
MIELALTKTLNGPAGRLRLDVRVDIEDGGITALFGPSGAGKTTLLRMIAGLTDPDEGRIVVGGQVWFDSVRRIKLPPQKRSIGFVFQDYALFPNLTVRQNVGYAVGEQDSAWIDELLAIMALTPLAHRLPSTLSGGQKQRVALARAIARKPALLLLDEPLSALDADLRSQLQDDLLHLHRRLGLATLLVSHDIGEVFKLSQQILQLEGGRVMCSGTPAQVFLQQRLAGKLSLQAQVLAIRREEVVNIVSLLVGHDMIEVIALDDEVRELREGDKVSLLLKTFSPVIFKTSTDT